MPRTLIEQTAAYRRFRVTDDAGQVIGEDTVAILTPEQLNEATVRQGAGEALTANAAFLALASPTNAQSAAQVKSLTRQCNALIRLALRRLESAD